MLVGLGGGGLGGLGGGSDEFVIAGRLFRGGGGSNRFSFSFVIVLTGSFFFYIKSVDKFKMI